MFKVGLLGYPLKHSISPLFQQAALDHYGLEARYELWETEPPALAAAVARLRQPDHWGANVTVPHKETVIPLLDEVDETASAIGAVNTIVNRGGRLVGYNTDAEGFMRSLEEAGFHPARKRVVVLGAGGVARAVAYALVKAGVGSLTIVNRTLERAQALAQDLAAEVMPWGDDRLAQTLSHCHLIVNCTSVGLKGSPTEGQSPLAPDLIPRGALVYDLVYNPPETPLLQEAKRVGDQALGGLPMLVYQGAASFELWTGKKAPLEVMFEAAQRALE